MPQLKELLQSHLAQKDLSLRTFSERTGISYPTILALLSRGHVPRKPEHREALRRELGLDQDAWAGVLAASQRDGVDIPAEGPLTLQQLVLKSMLAQGFTEQSFARISGVPYPTLMGLTRKGAIPRADTLGVIADKLGIPREDLDAAVEVSRERRDAEGDEADAPADDGEAEPHDDESGGAPALLGEPEAAPAANGSAQDEIPHLAQLVADRIASHGVSVAAFGRQHGIPYLSLNRLIAQGVPPRRKSVLEPLARALGLSEEVFETSLQKSKRSPTPATAPKDEDPLTPLQEALQRVVRARNLTTKAFAELADLSVLTATKLLKHGDLPGRQTTHEKLKHLLQLNEHEYQELVRRSRQDGERGSQPPPRVGEVPAIPVAGAAAAADGPTVAELAELIERLNSRQRAALKQFILTMI